MEIVVDGLDHPEGICVTPDGALYVGGEAGQIYRIDADGHAVEVLRTGGFILGLAADALGRIYAADTVHRCVWRVDPMSRVKAVFTRGSEGRELVAPNWGAFGPDGSYYLSDSGAWGGHDGLLWRVPPAGDAEVWSEESCCFPNGLAVAPDGKRLYVLESYTGALVCHPILADGTAGKREVICDLGSLVPDGIALASDGSMFIACYRPDAIYHYSDQYGLRLFAEDPRGTMLAAPTNLVFTGPTNDELIVPNIGRWHLTRLPAGITGERLFYPTVEQLGR
jgi:gluconolactonase